MIPFNAGWSTAVQYYMDSVMWQVYKGEFCDKMEWVQMHNSSLFYTTSGCVIFNIEKCSSALPYYSIALYFDLLPLFLKNIPGVLEQHAALTCSNTVCMLQSLDS